MKTISIPLLLFLTLILVQCNPYRYRTENIKSPTEETEIEITNTYKSAKLEKLIPFDLFRMAIIGFKNIPTLKQTDKIVIIDYSKESSQERFYLIDLKKKELLYKCLVAHGKNSGNIIPTTFSNISDSKQSSLGFFISAETYSGKHGYSLRIDGIEEGINHLARERDIVIHSADYVSQEFIIEHGRLGRSWGCPALPTELSEEIIRLISDGCCIFIYAEDHRYLMESKYILKNQMKSN